MHSKELHSKNKKPALVGFFISHCSKMPREPCNPNLKFVVFISMGFPSFYL